MQHVSVSDLIQINPNNECDPAFTQLNSAQCMVFIFGEVTTQLLILALVLKRTIWDFRQYSHLLFSILNRDGLIVFGAMGVAMIAIGMASAKKGAAAAFVFPCLKTLELIIGFSVRFQGSHTILNLQKLGSVDVDVIPSEQKKELELTAIWDERTFQTVDYLPNTLENGIVTAMPPDCQWKFVPEHVLRQSGKAWGLMTDSKKVYWANIRESCFQLASDRPSTQLIGARFFDRALRWKIEPNRAHREDNSHKR
ncbi:hypothetical protein BDP27DRAFT_1401931, partial [Rhodocollybia butyracea]